MICWSERAPIMVALVCVSVVPSASAGNKDCQSFRVLLQANLDLTASGVPWSGQVRGFLNSAEPLIGTLSYLPDVPGADSSQTGQAGHEFNDRAKFDFGTAGIFVTEPHTAVFPLRPTVTDPYAFGSYHATAKGCAGSVGVDRRVRRCHREHFHHRDVPGRSVLTGIGRHWNAEISGNPCSVH